MKERVGRKSNETPAQYQRRLESEGVMVRRQTIRLRRGAKVSRARRKEMHP